MVEATGSARVAWYRRSEIVALVVVLLIGVGDVAVGADTFLIGMLAVGPALAALAASARRVALVGLVAVGVSLVLSEVDGIWFTEAQLFYLLGLLTVTGVCILLADRRERALRESAAVAGHARRMAELVAQNRDAIAAISLDGTFTSWNATAEEMTGLPESAVLGRPIEAATSPARSAEYRAMLERVRRGEAIPTHVTSRQRPDGSRLDVSVSISPIVEDGRPVGASIVSRDVTAQQVALERLQASEERQRAILESAFDSVVSADQTGAIVEFNAAAEATFGWSREEVFGRPLAETLVSPEFRPRLLEQFDAAGSPDQARHARAEMTAVRRDGQQFPAEVTTTRVDIGAASLFTVYVRDLSALKQAEADRLALAHRLEQSQRLESLGQLAGGVAHDFNNILSVILNHADFVEEAITGNPEATADVQTIRAAAQRAARLTKQLLIVGRRETGNAVAVDLDDVVRGLQSLLTRSIEENVEIGFRLAGGLPLVEADPGQVEQVLLNLVGNARDAMPFGGTVTITTKELTLSAEEASAYRQLRPGRFVQLTVTDTGQGMPADVVEHVFEPFFTTKPLGQGTGLGLATVYGILTDAGGTVHIYSEPGLGTTVNCYFPVTATSGAEASPPGSPGRVGRPAAPLEEELILVVDDEEDLRRLTCRMLRRHGYTVEAAGSGAEALELARARRPRLLVSDVVMPKMSGPALAAALRAEDPELLVLFTSGYSDGMLDERATGQAAVAGSVLGKPFTEAELLERVQALLLVPAS